jgi:hypothetical protein
LSRSEEVTTDTDDMAMAAAAIHGSMEKPSGRKTPEEDLINYTKKRRSNRPAAIGMPTALYTIAKRKFHRIRAVVRFDRSIAATTSSKLFCNGDPSCS